MGHGRGKSSSYTGPPPVPPLLPSFGEWGFFAPPNFVGITVIFPVEMDPHVPLGERFIIKCDGTPHTPAIDVNWVMPTRLGMRTEYPIPSPTIVTLTYDGSDPDFKSVSGILVAAFTDFVLTHL